MRYRSGLFAFNVFVRAVQGDAPIVRAFAKRRNLKLINPAALAVLELHDSKLVQAPVTVNRRFDFDLQRVSGQGDSAGINQLGNTDQVPGMIAPWQ